MNKRISAIFALAAVIIVAVILATPSQVAYAIRPPTPTDDQCQRQGDCRDDPQPTHGQDCEEHGNNDDGNEDHCAPTATPTEEPTNEPTAAPTTEPTAAPTDEPSATPTQEPTAEPTATDIGPTPTEPGSVPTDIPGPTEPPVVPGPSPTAPPPCDEVVDEPCGELFHLYLADGRDVWFASFSPKPDGGFYLPNANSVERCTGSRPVAAPESRPLYGSEVLTPCDGGGCFVGSG